MQTNYKASLLVAVHGMDNRMVKMLTLYFQGPCGGIARIANNQEDSDVDMFDFDMPASKILLERHVQENIIKPVIVLSVRDIVIEGVLHIKKPIITDDMLSVLQQAKKLMSLFSNRESQPPSLLEPKLTEQKHELQTDNADTGRSEKIGEISLSDNDLKTEQPLESSTKSAAVDDPLQQLDDWFTSNL